MDKRTMVVLLISLVLAGCGYFTSKLSNGDDIPYVIVRAVRINKVQEVDYMQARPALELINQSKIAATSVVVRYTIHTVIGDHSIRDAAEITVPGLKPNEVRLVELPRRISMPRGKHEDTQEPESLLIAGDVEEHWDNRIAYIGFCFKHSDQRLLGRPNTPEFISCMPPRDRPGVDLTKGPEIEVKK